jgi:hypothetical protein
MGKATKQLREKEKKENDEIEAQKEANKRLETSSANCKCNYD